MLKINNFWNKIINIHRIKRSKRIKVYLYLSKINSSKYNSNNSTNNNINNNCSSNNINSSC